MPRCVAVFCGNTGDAGLGMFSFPKDPELNLVWRQNMKRTKSAREPNKLWENTVHSKMCGAHFNESCFTVNRLLTLIINSYNNILSLRR